MGTVRWVDDRLPALERLTAEGGTFDFMLCSAVLMHLQASELAPAFRAMTGLLEAGGRIAISLRDEGEHDPRGLFVFHSDGVLRMAAEQARLRLVRASGSADALGRGLRWRLFVFEKPSAKVRRPSGQPGGGQMKIS